MHKGYFRVEADGAGGFRFFRSSDGAELVATPVTVDLDAGHAGGEGDGDELAELATGFGEKATAENYGGTLEALFIAREEGRSSAA